MLGHSLIFLTPTVQNNSFSKVLLKHTNVYTVPTLFLLRHHQHDTHEAWGQKVCKDCPQVVLVKTVFIFLGLSVFKLGGMGWRNELHLAK